MNLFLLLLTIILSLAIIGLILMQGRGAGLGSAWGGGGEMYSTRRGLEKWTLRLTVFFIALFFIVSLINLMV